MQVIIENRASVILYNVIVSNELNRGKILLPANICPIVPATLLKANVEFEFFDINLTDYLPETDELYHIINNSKNISAVLYNHTYGIEKNTDTIFQNIKDLNKSISIIDDCCLIKPNTIVKKTVADITLFSTGYSKYVDFGIGGFAFLKENVKYNTTVLKFSEKEYKNIINSFNKVLIAKKKYRYKDTRWLNTKKTELTKEEYFRNINDKIIKTEKHKIALNNIYKENINEKFHLGDIYNNWRFNILVNNKEFVLKKIFENKLFASSHYQSLVGIFGVGKGKNVDILHSQVINLFNDFRYNEEKALLISDIINKYAE